MNTVMIEKEKASGYVVAATPSFKRRILLVDDKRDIVIIYLTLQILVLSGLYCKALERAANAEGRLTVIGRYITPDGTCFAKGGKC